MSGVLRSNEQKTSAPSSGKEQGDTLSVKWALLCAAVVVAFAGAGVILQKTMLGRKTLLIAECKQNPKYAQECEEILANRSPNQPRPNNLASQSIRKPNFQLRGSDDDLTPPPGKGIFRK